MNAKARKATRAASASSEAQQDRERYARLYEAICGERGDTNRHEQVCAVIRLLETGSYL